MSDMRDARTGPFAQAVHDAVSAFTDGLPVALLMLDRQGLASRANAAFAALCGLAPAEVLGLGWRLAVHPDSQRRLDDALAAGGAFALGLRLRRADGSKAWVELKARPQDGGMLCTVIDVTADRLRERAARGESERFRLLADNLPVLIAYYASEDRVCRYANRQYARTFGHEPGAVVGRRLDEIIGPAAAALIEPQVTRVLDERQVARYERGVTVAGGEELIFDVHLLPHLDRDGRRTLGVFVLMSDVTRYRQAERQARSSDERLRKFMQASTEGIAFIRHGLVVDANPPLLALLGHALDGVVGRPVLDFVAPELRGGLRARTAQGEDVAGEASVLHRDGHRIPVEFRLRTMNLRGEALQMVIVRDQRDRLAAQARIHFLAHHDPLTGLPNRGTFLDLAEQLFARAQAETTRVALLFVDIDHFKRVNDSLGHLAGDAMLKTVAQRITDTLRVTDLVGRFAGDEFVVLLGGNPERAAIEEVARKLLEAIERPMTLDGPSISVTSSIGIAVYPDHTRDPAELLKQADTAMYHAKARGRARLSFFEPAMARAAYDALVLESDLAQALREGQFELAYQPQVRAGDGALVGLEALVRWNHPERGWVSPDEFIPLAEQRRLMLGIGQWVLGEALRETMRLRRAGWADLRVGVNLTAIQLRGTGFVELVRQALADNGADATCLELEITERMLMDDLPGSQATLQALRADGVHFALDDFGTGYTSLSQLKTLRVDRLKIDRSFVQDLPQDAASAAVAEAIIRLARGLNLDVVAEGVETAAQWRWLAEHGCPQVQGHLVALPMTAGQLHAWLDERLTGPRA